MKSFSTEGASAPDRESVEFEHDGWRGRFFEPTNGQSAVMGSTRLRRGNDSEFWSGMIDFFFGTLDEESKHHFEKRLLDGSDPFELDSDGGVLDMVNWVLDSFGKEKPDQD